MASSAVASQTKYIPLGLLSRCHCHDETFITLLVVVTTIPAVFMATGGIPETWHLMLTLLGAGGASGSAAIFNQLVEKDIDLSMKRTRARSLPSNRVSTTNAAIIGTILGLLSFALLYFYVTPLSAYVAIAGHVFYVLVYTVYLKRRTPQNIVIGGAAGAVGPLIGWASVTSSLSLVSWLLFLIIVLWTPPHFWALSLKYKKDYAAAGIPMYPVVYGDERTRKVIFLYTLTLIPCIIVLGYLANLYLITSAINLALTLKFAKDAYTLYKSKNNIDAMPLFYFSCLYTFAIFIILTCDQVFLHILS